MTATVVRHVPVRLRQLDWPARGAIIALVLMALGLIVPAAFQWHVHANSFAPLSSRWRPRLGPGTLPAIVTGAAAVRWLPGLAARLSWPRLLALTYGVGVTWMVSLATVDGWTGIGGVLTDKHEYLPTARAVTSVPDTLRAFIGRISSDSAHPWATHVAGHPPGALLFFVVLVALGLGGGLTAGCTVVLIAATTPLAVLTTLRRFGAEQAARRVAPILTVGPAAVWLAVSADAVFSAVAAWALCTLAVAATAPTGARRAGWSVLAGVLLGCTVLLSYGLLLMAVLAAAVLLVARSVRPIMGAAIGTLAVVLAFAAAGYAYWAALPVVRVRYLAGIASIRPASYWLWGDLAALCFSAGPIVGASIATAIQRRRAETERPVVLLTLAAAVSIVLADLSLMSKAETERIWLPFVPWLLLGLALLPGQWRRRALIGQVVLAIGVQSLLFTRW